MYWNEEDPGRNTFEQMKSSTLDFKFEVSTRHHSRDVKLAVRYKSGGVCARDIK